MGAVGLFDLYDSINTTAVRWLQYNSKTRGCPLGIKNFNRKDKAHMWLLMQLNFNSIYNNYEKYYIDGSFFSYLYLRYFKHFKYLRRVKKEIECCLIDVDIFCNEIIEGYNNKNSEVIDKCIFEFIYDDYYGEYKYGG